MRCCLRRPTARTGRSGPKTEPSRPALTSTKTSARPSQGDDVELAEAGAGVALDELPARRGEPLGDEVLGRPADPLARLRHRKQARSAGARQSRARSNDFLTSSAQRGKFGSVACPPCSPPPGHSRFDGISARPVRVEVDVHRGLPDFSIVGLPDAAVREARERVRAALVNCGFEFPLRRIVANLAPASLRKAGPGMDLAIAAALLTASGQLSWEALPRLAMVGELALDGSVRPVSGALAIAEAARERGAEAVVVPAENGPEAALVEGIEVIGLESLGQLPPLAAGEWAPERPEPLPLLLGTDGDGPDLADLRGQRHLRYALEVAAAGGHSLLMIGPPGAGKSLAARRLPSILPPLAPQEALEVARIASACGRLEGVAGRRPPLPGAPPHDQPGRAGRRRQPAQPRRGDPGPSRRPLPRRALRVPPRRAGGAAGAAGDRRGLDRPRRRLAAAALPLHAGRGGQPVPLRARRSRRRVQLRAAGGAALPGRA